MPRIIAGEFRSRRLYSPDERTGSRPYLDRVKESVFNLLRGWFEDAGVLDLFAGVGTMGLEAVSRGATRVVMVEKNVAIYKVLEQNIAALGCGDRATAVHGDALSPAILQRVTPPVEIVFVDPPFDMMGEALGRRRVLQQIAACRAVMGDRGFVVLRISETRDPETGEMLDWSIAGFDGPEVHTYGKSSVLLYAPRRPDDVS
jgi:16S rRNA (guanine(966)-N(2))-methyltransferase RsmD